MIYFPLRKSPTELARFGAHWCPPTSSFVVPRARLREKEASPQSSPAPAPALLALRVPASARPSFVSSMCVSCGHACVRAMACVPLLLCLGFCFQTTEKGSRVCVALIHLISFSICIQTPSRHRAPAPRPFQQPQQVLQPASLSLAAAASKREGQAASPALSGPLLSSPFLYWQMLAEPERALEGTEVGKRNPAEDFTKTPAYNQLKSSSPLFPFPPDPMHSQPHQCICLNISLMSLELTCNTNVTHFT